MVALIRVVASAAAFLKVRLFAWFGVTPRRWKTHGSADCDRKCFLRRFAIKALSRESHCVIAGSGIGMSEDCAIGGHSIAEIPTIGERGDSVFGHSAG